MGRYSDEFRAKAVALLTANGYPEKKGAMTRTASNLNIPHATLSRWANEVQNPAPSDLVQEKKLDIAEALTKELVEIFKTMDTKRNDANYRELSTALGIVIEKIQLVSGDATQRIGFDQRNSAVDAIREKLSKVVDNSGAPEIPSDID